MKKAVTEYRRTLSQEEVQGTKLMIMKEALKFFPKPFKKFSLAIGEKTFELAVEAEDCQCRGPAQPHQHFWLPMKESAKEVRWGKGATVVIGKVKEGEYRLTAG